MYRCDRCGRLFDEPDTRTFKENLDGENGWWTHTEEYSPHCGGEDFKEVDEDEPED